MGIAVFRNRVTTEFRKTEQDSDEFNELVAQRDPNDGRPVWEQTSMPNAIEQSQRLQEGEQRPEDLGDANQPYATTLTAGRLNTRPASEVQGREPTPAERASGIDPSDWNLTTATGATASVANQAMGDSGQDPDTARPLVDGMGEDATDLSGTAEDALHGKEMPSERAARLSAEQRERGFVGGTANEGYNPDTDDYDAMTGKDLDIELEARDLSKSGTVADKRHRLRADDGGGTPGDVPTDERD